MPEANSNSNMLCSLLGDTLMGKDGEVKTSEALTNKTAIALYFSAHWCPPCRGFTPQLAEWYTKDLKAKGLEVIFVSSDQDEEAFKEYFGEQPWLALPFAERDLKTALSKKFKVSGIPSLVILDGEGKTITKDGRAAVSGDPTGQDMPWKPKTFKELMSTAKLVDGSGKEQSYADATAAAKATAFYFSAHWCPPCRGFTPDLAKWYTADLKAKGLEVVFVSSDRDEAAFKEYFGEQPWLALSYEDRKLKEELSTFFGVNGIPSLCIVSPEGEIITKEGRGAVSGDPTGTEFPWYPKPVANLKAGPGQINEVTTVLCFAEKADSETQKACEAAMTPFAEAQIAAAKAKGEEDPEFAFMMVTEGDDLAMRIRTMFQMEEGSIPKLMICDIPDDGGYYEGPAAEAIGDVLEGFLADYSAKKLERKQLQ